MHILKGFQLRLIKQMIILRQNNYDLSKFSSVCISFVIGLFKAFIVYCKIGSFD